jgi:methyl-accepting chemotaxis protein
MRTLPTLFAIAVVTALVLAPLASAASSITISSPASGSTVKDGSYTIAGTVTPAPGQLDTVGITVKNPSGTVVDTEQASADPTSGAWTFSAVAGGPLWSASGTYTITATDSLGATPGSSSFAYTAPSQHIYNVTRALVNIQGNLTRLQAEMLVLQKDQKGNSTQEQTALTSIQSALTTLTSNLNTLSGSVNTLQSGVTGIASQVTSIASQVGTINTAVSGLSTQVGNAATQAKAAADAVSSTQTYVLVVAVLAAITLVLELAILVRKLS